MPDEKVTIDFQAIDNVSKVAERISKRLDNLEKKIIGVAKSSALAKTPEAYSAWEEKLKNLLSEYRRLERELANLKRPFKDQEALLEGYNRAFVRTYDQQRQIVNSLLEHHNRMYVQNYEQRRRLINQLLEHENRTFVISKERRDRLRRQQEALAERERRLKERELLEDNRLFVKQWELRRRWLEQQKRMLDERRITTRLQRLSRTLRRFAADTVWATLSILGVVWSMDAALRFSLDPLQRYVEQLSNWENVAFGVATWMAIAQRVSEDTGMQIKTLNVDMNKLADTAMLLKATWGSLDQVMLAFLANVIDKTPNLKEKLVDTFNKLIDVLSNQQVIQTMGNFIMGVLDGINTMLDKLPQLVKFLDDLFATLANMVLTAFKPFTEVLRQFVPGFGELVDKIWNTESGFKKLGIAIGALGTVFPILAPMLTFFQALGSIIQAVVFGVASLTGLLGGLGKIGDLLGGVGGAGGGKLLKPLFDKVVNFLRGKFSRVLGSVGYSAIKSVLDKLKVDNKTIGSIASVFKSAFSKFLGALGKDESAKMSLAKIGESVIDKLSKSKKVIEALGGLFRKALDYAFTSGALGAIATRARQVGGVVRGAFTNLGEFTVGLPSVITTGLAGWIPQAAYQVGRFFNWIPPRTVTVHQSVYIGRVEKTADVDELTDRLWRDAWYSKCYMW